jgi:hypothetical protein
MKGRKMMILILADFVQALLQKSFFLQLGPRGVMKVIPLDSQLGSVIISTLLFTECIHKNGERSHIQVMGVKPDVHLRTMQRPKLS